MALVVLGALITGSSSVLQAQQGSSSPIHTGQMPDARFYSLVFRHLLYLHENGPQAAVATDPSPAVESFYSTRVRATKRETALLLAEAKVWKTEVTPVDDQAHAIVMAIRAKTPGGKLAPGETPPSVPQELLDLQQQRDAITVSHAAHLREMFGNSRYEEITTNIRRETHLTLQRPNLDPNQAAAFRAFAQSRRVK